MKAQHLSAGLDALFRPASIAVIGASTDAAKIGGRPVDYLKRAGFKGRILPVNPGQREVQGLPAFASLDDAPGSVDLVVVAVPAAAVPEAIESCIRKGARAVVLFSAGFGEVDAKGRAAQQAILARCQAAGIRLLGPNALGLINPGDGVYCTFTASLGPHWPRPGKVAIASQSGAVGTYCYTLLADRGCGISHLVTTGNEADIDIAACIAWLAEDPATEVILTYLEGCRDGARLRAALRLAAERGKRVVAMKVGVSEQGAAATASHTGTLAGSDAGYQAAFEEAGVWRASSLSEAADVAAACAAGDLPQGRRLGIVTVSGGAGAFMADMAATEGLGLPALPDAAQAEIRALLPFAAPRNPVDSTAQVANDRSLLGRMLAIMLREGGFDVLIAFLGFMGEDPARLALTLPALEELRARHPGTRFILCMRCLPAVRLDLHAKGFVTCVEPAEAMRIATALCWLGERGARQDALALPPASALPEGDLDEAACRRLLEAAGIPFAPQRVARNAAEAADAAATLGFPVVLKVLSPDLAHKSDVGGVRLNLRDAAEVATAFEAMLAEVRARAPAARIEGALVSPMVRDGVEVVLGATRDPVFGPLVMFGLGGVFVELFRDVAFRLAPIDHAGALAMLRSIKGRALLQGARGRQPVDEGALAEALVALSRFAAAHGEALESVEVNPFMALPQGGMGVDAVILRRSRT
ncbi:acetate--CoA ligase family protein [Siccirubricoccus sp. G192]|uniref:acetate--CoA ligase family protein n=1 Tax=Siccirubricoccus sp. G192 TaxID=2849651 RepID=UPI001C2C3F9E|nr:acetate--CoA ligase family protein [Siccirubricoccus sp. G192]MBV1799948.1 acetate--CoA ligase family protein [Siccirubricoccus sp. G192]